MKPASAMPSRRPGFRFSQRQLCITMSHVRVSRYRQFGEAGLQPRWHAGAIKSKLPAAITEQIVALKQQHYHSRP